MSTDDAKPKACKPEHLTYLDNLSKQGVINMWEVPRRLRDHFNLDTHVAHAIYRYWKYVYNKEQS